MICAALDRRDKDSVYCDGRARKVVEKEQFWILLISNSLVTKLLQYLHLHKISKNIHNLPKNN